MYIYIYIYICTSLYVFRVLSMLQLLQAFYYEGKAIMSNEEFDNLKEELMWEGSSVVMLSMIDSHIAVFNLYV